MDDLTEFPVAHELCRLLKRRGVAVTEVHHVDDARFLGHTSHAKRIGVVRGERLLAEDVLAGGNRLKRERRVQAVRSHIRNGINATFREQFLEVGEYLRRSAVLRSKLFRPLGIDIADGCKLDARDFQKLCRMDIRHASGSDNADPDFFTRW